MYQLARITSLKVRVHVLDILFEQLTSYQLASPTNYLVARCLVVANQSCTIRSFRPSTHPVHAATRQTRNALKNATGTSYMYMYQQLASQYWTCKILVIFDRYRQNSCTQLPSDPYLRCSCWCVLHVRRSAQLASVASLQYHRVLLARVHVHVQYNVLTTNHGWRALTAAFTIFLPHRINREH